jgi:asparagine synthase (glutamine-hydrolysing)
MCGIWALIEKSAKEADISKYLADFWQLKQRGPDNSHFETFNQVYVGFHRLAIMDTSYAHRARSNQPYIFNDIDRTIVFICNGEIYNFQQLDKKYNLNIGTSDCMVIPKLYLLAKDNQGNPDYNEWFHMVKNEVKGEFAFVMFEFDNMKQLTKYYAGRDMIGVRPLYTVSMNNNIDMFSSEIKGMSSFDGKVVEFEPGTIVMVEKTLSYYSSHKFDMKLDLYKTKYNSINFYKSSSSLNKMYDTDINLILPQIRNSVINSIKRRLHADRPIAFLLSGGVDSSLVASISAKILSETNGHIRTFCCGIKGSTDMIYAKKVAEHIGSNHTEVFFTEEEGLAAIDDVIKTTETWDITTIRASVGQYLVSKYISQHTDCKVVLVGEGPDEVCSSYLFNYYAPNGEELDKSSKEYVRDIHMYDGRRADRCVSRWGLETRIPLLDPEFIDCYWSIEPKLRMPVTHSMEKYLFRKAFSDLDLLPNEVLWRKKEAFSDGVSSKERSWFQMIQEHIDKKFETNDYQIPTEILNGVLIPPTKESQYYLYKFIEYFGINRVSILPNYWQPRWTNKEGQKFIDPSARVLNIYNNQ